MEGVEAEGGGHGEARDRHRRGRGSGRQRVHVPAQLGVARTQPNRRRSWGAPGTGRSTQRMRSSLTCRRTRPGRACSRRPADSSEALRTPSPPRCAKENCATIVAESGAHFRESSGSSAQPPGLRLRGDRSFGVAGRPPATDHWLLFWPLCLQHIQPIQHEVDLRRRRPGRRGLRLHREVAVAGGLAAALTLRPARFRASRPPEAPVSAALQGAGAAPGPAVRS